MVDSKPDSQVPSPTMAGKSGGGRQRTIQSCLTCRRRKVKCDHEHPICGACTRGSHVCTWSDHSQGQASAGRIAKPSSMSGSGRIAKTTDVQSRLDRLELLLEKAVSGQGGKPSLPARAVENELKDHEAAYTPSSTSQTSHGGGMADDGDGTLLLDGGQSKFVSSLHYALLAEEVSRHGTQRWLVKLIGTDSRHKGSAWRQKRRGTERCAAKQPCRLTFVGSGRCRIKPGTASAEYTGAARYSTGRLFRQRRPYGQNYAQTDYSAQLRDVHARDSPTCIRHLLFGH